jgi:hypothetical protein
MEKITLKEKIQLIAIVLLIVLYGYVDHLLGINL